MKKALLLAGLTLSQVAMADTVSGTLTFDKKAAFVGLFYANEGASGPAAATMDQKNKVFTDKLAVVGKGGNVTFNNSDDFQHNIFANDPNTNVKFDVGLIEPGQTSNVSVDWSENTLTRVGCKIHPRMRTYIANVTTETYQVIDFEKKNKSYDIKLDVTASQNSFSLVIPKYDKIDVTLAKGESKTVDVTRKGKKKATLTLSRS